MTVGQRIKLRRKELGMSADALAIKIGKDRSTVFRYERGDIENLPLDILKPVAEALLITPQALMGWDEIPTTNDAVTKNSNGMSEAKRELLDLVENCSDEEVSRLLQMMELFLGKK